MVAGEADAVGWKGLKVMNSGRVGMKEARFRLLRIGDVLKLLTNDMMWRAWIVVLAFLGWFFLAESETFSELMLPSPQRVWGTFVVLADDGYSDVGLGTHIWISLIRLIGAFLVVCIVGIPLGLAMGYSKIVKAVFDPIIEFYRPVPPLAYLTVLIAWFGIGELPKFLLLFLVGLPLVSVPTFAAVVGVQPERINGARSLGATDFQVFRYIILPSCLPQIMTSMRIAFGLTFAALVAAEMIAASSGLGWMARHAAKFLRTDVVFVSIFIMAAAAVSGEWLLRWVERRLVPWSGKA